MVHAANNRCRLVGQIESVAPRGSEEQPLELIILIQASHDLSGFANFGSKRIGDSVRLLVAKCDQPLAVGTKVECVARYKGSPQDGGGFYCESATVVA